MAYKPKPAILFLRGLSTAVKTQFHAKCVRRSRTMTDVIEALMKFYLDNPAAVESYVDEVIANRPGGRGRKKLT